MNTTITRPFVLNYRVAYPGTKLVVIGSRIKQPQGVAARRQLQIKCLVKIFPQWDWTNSLTFFLQGCNKLVPTHRLDKKLQPRFHACFALTVAIEKAHNRSRQI